MKKQTYHYCFMNSRKQPNKFNRFCLFPLILFFVCFSIWLARTWTWWTDTVSITRELLFMQGVDGQTLASSMINMPNILLQPPQLIQILRKETLWGNRLLLCFQLFSFPNLFPNVLDWSIAAWFIKTLTYINVCRYGC